jgi:pimeloyl-ACP methyl ester carboxylesterase
VFFIHGFNGDAIKTWVEFPTYLTTDPRFKECDFFFYGYDSLRQQINFTAAAFHLFIEAVYKENDALYGSSIGRALGLTRKKITYSNIVIVAHSMGAVITRLAIINGIRNSMKWVPKSKMILFAPAHRGARVNKLLAASFPPVIDAIVGVLRFKIVTIDELDPASETLADLMKSSKHFLGTSHKKYDNVVQTLDFLDDPVPTPLKGTHVTVCKPNQGFKDPLNIIAKHI